MNDENEMLLGVINDTSRAILVRDGFHNVALYIFEDGVLEVMLPADASCEAILSKLRVRGAETYAVVREVPNGRKRQHVLRVLLVTKNDGMGEIITEFQKVGRRVIIGNSQREDEVMTSEWSIWGRAQIDLGEGEEDDFGR